MNLYKLAFRRLFRKGEHSTARIISLSVGLAFGILLLAEVFYFHSFNNFYPDANRIYTVRENIKIGNSSDKLESHDYVSGAIAPGLKAEVPGIVEACRLNSIGKNVFYTNDKKSYEAEFSLSDEFLFDVLSRPIISGNPKEILKTPMNCMVSTKVAEEIGGDVVGKIIELKKFPDEKLTIAGIFEALPENTNYEFDVLISMVSTEKFTWDGTNNWMGNDRYYACVKLEAGINPRDLAPAVRAMQVKHQDIEKMEEENEGMEFSYSFHPIKQIQAEKSKDMIIILTTIALAVLFVSILNYILLTLNVLINRAKISAIQKTCGARNKNIQGLIFSETILVFLISITIAFLIILVVKKPAEIQLEHKLNSILNPIVIWPILLILTFIIAASSYLPGRFFSRIPVTSAFNTYKLGKNKWKLVLLSVQFIGASFILSTLVIVNLQYNKMKYADHGYRAKDVYYGSTVGMDGNKLNTVLNELRALPEIETVGLGNDVPFNGASGNNIRFTDDNKDLFNIADFYEVDENYLSILGINVTEGNTFSTKTASTEDIIISKRGADLLAINSNWKTGVVGKQVRVTGHDEPPTICGVFPDFIINSIADPDNRPSVFFYWPEEKFIKEKIEGSSWEFNILIKKHEGSTLDIKKVTEIFNLAMPQNDASIKILEEEQQLKYASEKGFKNAMMAGNIVILLITIIGLLGYTTNEAIRRQKELAIRRISGAKLVDILKVFINDLESITIPAVMIGITISWLILNRWMENFAYKIPLHWGIFALCSLAIIAMVAIIAAVNYSRTASKNPAETLRYE